MPATYINPLTDFGFKKLFGEEPNKELLISFLNTLLPEHHQIADLKTEQDKWLYLLLHLAELSHVPGKFNEADLPLEIIHLLRQEP